jgi:hypothetical protein
MFTILSLSTGDLSIKLELRERKKIRAKNADPVTCTKEKKFPAKNADHVTCIKRPRTMTTKLSK